MEKLEQSEQNSNFQETTNEKEIEVKQVQDIMPPPPVLYSNLLKKIKEESQVSSNNDEQNNSEIKTSKPLKTRGFKKSENTNINKKHNFKKNYNLNNNDVLPRLDNEKFKQELIKYQKLFMNELKQYLSEEIKTRDSKESNEINGTNESKEKSNVSEKKRVNKSKMTNLERIQSGSTSINIVRTICSRSDDLKMVWVEKLITNREMDFLTKLNDFISKYDIKITYKSPKVILFHSPYLMV